jgi:hypothetical protein
MADWGLQELLLRRLDLHLAGANWQRGGGKSSSRPQPIELPDGKGRGSRPASSGSSGEETARRLRNLGMIPADAISD